MSRGRAPHAALLYWLRGAQPWIGGLDFAQRALLLIVATANVVLVVITLPWVFGTSAGHDWQIYLEAGRRVFVGGLYEWGGPYAWSYSPLLAYAFAILAPLGYLGWTLLHIVALGALRTAPIVALILLLSWPFWVDVYNGNTMVFVVVAAALASHGSRLATMVYFALCLLMPRPIMLPLLIWILWRRRQTRVPFGILAIVNAIAIWLTGYASAWIQALLRVNDAVGASARDIGPAAIFGNVWVVLGAALAFLFTVRGRVGWASLAASPYWLPQYLLMAVLEAPQFRPSSHDRDDRARPSEGAATDPSPWRGRLWPRRGTRVFRDPH